MTVAIVLAAGRGSRLGAVGEGRPKCLTPIAGRPLIDWQRAAFESAGITRRIVVTGYAAGQLAPAPGETLVHCSSWADGGPLQSLLCVDRETLAGGFILAYGDCVWHPDWLVALASTPGAFVLPSDTAWEALWSLRFADPLADAETFRAVDGRLVEIGARPRSRAQVEGQFTGLLAVRAEGWCAIEEVLASWTPAQRRRADVTYLLAQLLGRGSQIVVLPRQGRWIELDSDQDLQAYEAMRAASRPWSHDWRPDPAQGPWAR